MKKQWKKSLINTLNAETLADQVKLAARSWCDYGPFR